MNFGNPSKLNYPCLLIAREKHGSLHYYIGQEAELYKAAYSIVEQRESDHWYDYPEEDKIAAKKIVDAHDWQGAWEFLNNRVDYEYEEFEIECFDNLDYEKDS